MSDKEQMPVSGGGPNKGDADGVNEPGRGAGCDSAGGAYQSPHENKDGDTSIGGFLGHGGQSEIAYHGAGQPQDRSDLRMARRVAETTMPTTRARSQAQPAPIRISLESTRAR